MKTSKAFKALLLMIFILMLPSMLYAQQGSDAQIKAELQRRLQINPQVGNITIQVQNGVVTLSGTVNSLAQKMSILNVARRTVGVRSVVDKINVVVAQKRSDADIERSVRQALVGNLSKDELAAIRIQSVNGAVTLTGTLTNSYPKQVAGVLSSWVPGVTSVQNNIVVKPAQSQSDIALQAEIISRYKKNPFIDAQNVHVTVENGVVRLTGIVSDYLAAEQAEAVARFVPGVVDVINQLYVSTP